MGKRASRWMSLMNKAKAFVSMKSSKKSRSNIDDNIHQQLPSIEPALKNGQENHFQGAANVEESKKGWVTAAATPGVELEIVIPIPAKEFEKAQDSIQHPQSDDSQFKEDCHQSKDEQDPDLTSAAVKIQAAFRGFMARKRVSTIKGFERLRLSLHGRATKKQTLSALRCMQSFAKMQSQVKSQRSRLTELQAQQRKERDEKRLEEELEDWDDSIWSKEQIHARVKRKHQAAVKRERTLAYAFSHQLWRSYPKDLSPPSVDQDEEKPAWSWSWLEQWMTSHCWESLEESQPREVRADQNTNPVKLTSVTSTLTSSPLRKGSPKVVNGKINRSPSPMRDGNNHKAEAKVHSHDLVVEESGMNGGGNFKTMKSAAPKKKMTSPLPKNGVLANGSPGRNSPMPISRTSPRRFT